LGETVIPVGSTIIQPTSGNMRINIVSPEFPPDIGGVETYAYEFTKELARRGHEVTVFTRRHPQGEASLPGVVVRPVLTLRRNLDRKTLARHSADIWHVMNAAYAWLALEGKTTVVSVHGNDFLRPHIPIAQYSPRGTPVLWQISHLSPAWLKPFWLWRTRRLFERALPRARQIIAISRYTEKAFLDRYPACRGKTSVGFLGVGEAFFSVEHHARQDGTPRLLTVCRLSEPRKNVDRVIRALATLRNGHDFRYTVIGDGHRRPQLERLAQELGLQDRIRFTGRVGEAELLQAYSEADLFVLTRRYCRAAMKDSASCISKPPPVGCPSWRRVWPGQPRPWLMESRACSWRTRPRMRSRWH
jgi:phosphatidylinositol alpha-1,6-mannosyltransferase